MGIKENIRDDIREQHDAWTKKRSKRAKRKDVLDFEKTESWSKLYDCVIKLRKMFVFQKKSFLKFFLQVIVFLATAVAALLNIFIFDNEIVAIVVSAINLYYIYQFSMIGWYSTEHYFMHTNVQTNRIDLENGEVRFVKHTIYGCSTSFIVLIMILSLMNSLVLTSQVVYFFDEDYPVIVAVGEVIVNILLIPSFIKLFETMIERRRAFYGTLNNAFVKQSEAMTNLFEKYEFNTNYTTAYFPEYNLKTHHNIFFVDGSIYSENDKKTIEEANIKLIEYYKELWKDYQDVVKILRTLAATEKNVPWRRLRGLTMHYFKIWETFFELK